METTPSNGLDQKEIRSYALSMGRSSNRDKIVEAGVAAIWERGFSTSGIRDIAAAAGVPQGSFSNHFRSKEEFGLIVLDRYFEMIAAIVGETLQGSEPSPIIRLRSYFETVTELLARHGWRHGCLIGNMSLDSVEASDAIRHRLAQIFMTWKKPFAETVVAAQLAGEIRRDLDSEDLAEFLLAGWHGALLRMKVDRQREPLDRFKRIVFAVVLSGGTGGCRGRRTSRPRCLRARRGPEVGERSYTSLSADTVRASRSEEAQKRSISQDLRRLPKRESVSSRMAVTRHAAFWP